ncbi:AAA family ATPase [Polyangium fumosum]|uniref:GAF domain-containing protein n=1 Tax=Polyangium fumosum TaxID=889272 RepID=A0A4U1IZI1_9BACT|nr:AAA family ATPase [Polyangium fumosum]TKD00071.1 GAF domain-containing protein [Polyangium fumosum]
MDATLFIPNYSGLDKIHEGPGVALYRGLRENDRTPVVLKVTRGEHPHPRELARLRHEHALLRMLEGPGILKAHALLRHGAGLALVLEDTGGESLTLRLRRGPLDLRACLDIALALARILDGVHARGVIHKDVNPNNVLVGERPADVRLIDFGIATLLAHESAPAGGHAFLEGTLAYIAPEQTGLLRRTVDSRADLYSLGATIYEMLTGALPFDEQDPIDLVHSHAARMPVPPHERRHGIPDVVSAIVMKLLAKAAEDRYQQAAALAADLARCVEALDKGAIEPFELGRRDLRDTLTIPEKLYGREADVAALLSTFDRMSRGGAEIVLLAGAAGVGKSVLVQEVQRALALRGGNLVAGKFDALRRDMPFSAFIQIFREIVKGVLSEPPDRFEERRSALLAALGQGGALLIDLVPELERVIGPQPPAPPAGPVEAQNRLGMLMQSFVRALSSPQRLLVFFIDDLQWADAASLWLMRLLTTDPAGSAVMLLGAYRDTEVDETHPLRMTLREIRKQGVIPTELAIRPLDEESLVRLLGDTFPRSDPARLRTLAGQLGAKTGGNPFFLSQLLLALHRDGLFRVDRAEGKWSWDDAEIAAAPIADNVADLMAARLGQLDLRAQQMVSLAACIGREFDLSTLHAIAGEPPGRVAASLWPALREGYLVPLDQDYLLLPTSDDVEVPSVASGFPPPDGMGIGGETPINARYRFLHDRVEQAAYALAPAEVRAKVHLRIGRRLHHALGEGARPEELFEAARQFNAGATHIKDAEEKRTVARLDLQAGRAARGQGAYSEAAAFLAAGVALVHDEGWIDEDDLTFSLLRDQAECEAMAGRTAQADVLIDRILARAVRAWQRADAYGVRVIMYTSLGRFSEAMDAGRAALALLGVDLPPTPEEAEEMATREVERIDHLLAEGGAAALLASPELTDPEELAAARILPDLLVPAYCIDIRFWKLVLATQTSRGMTRGHCGSTAQSYVSYGFYLAGALGRYAESRVFGEVGLGLAETHGDPALLCKVTQSFATFAGYAHPLRRVVPHFARARQLSLQSGELVYGSFACVFVPVTLFRLGDPLDVVTAEARRSAAILKRIQNPMSSAQLVAIQQTIACLRGDTESPTSFNDGTFDEAAWVAGLDPVLMGFVRVLYFTYKTLTLFLHDRPEAALPLLESAEEAAGAVVGHHWPTDLPFHASLVLAAVYPDAKPEEKPRLLDRLVRYRDKLASLAGACPENTAHRHALVAAEIARLEGRPSEAIDAYEQALALAGKHGFSQDEAITNELYGLFFLGRGQSKNARTYLTEAHYGYLRWGATIKVAQLERKHRALLSTPDVPSTPTVGPGTTTLSIRSTVGKLLDLTTAVRAAQALSGEIVLDQLIQRLMRIILANAGAERGFLILDRNGAWVVEARFQVSPDLVESRLDTPLEARADLAQSIVRYVARTQEPLVLESATRDPRFAADAHVRSAAPQSVLAVALTHQGRCRGVLYLEHNRTAGAFAEERLEFLQMLCAQAVISIENAMLYDRLQSMGAELRELNQHLEQGIARRTEELSAAKERLEQELEERAQAETARAALQEEIIQMQSARLDELSMPLIPITEEILVLPLIGTMDAPRAEAMMEAVLHGAQAHRTRTVIIDVTGMKRVDARAAGALLQSASALRLIGAEVVLTGMRPDFARAIVDLDLDLTAIVTKGTLQSGIAYAMGRARRRN